ncbi:MAG: hypothetical protein DMF63_17845 [Acidobacteria bacterium]|nr:MAG: hypothetical protein DMF63_17845 [Acidobacteriota bacterium]
MTSTRPFRLSACLVSMIRTRSIARFASVFLLLTLSALSMLAQPTLLDPTFSDDGKVSTHILDSGSWGNDAVLQPDGKIVVVGAGNNHQVGVVRFNQDGALDSSFDGDGRVWTSMNAISEARCVALQADGKIVLAGVMTPDNLGAGPGFMVRYNTDGSLDTSFDGDGIRLYNYGQFSTDTSRDIAIQPDGKILILEFNFTYQVASGLLIARYNPDGSVDSTFGGGTGVFRREGQSGSSESMKLALQPDGKIVFTGYNNGWLVGRLNSDGTPDLTFGSGGVTTGGLGGYALALQADGKIVIAHRSTTFPVNVRQVINRLNTDGTLDTTFGTDGSTLVQFVNQEDTLCLPPDLIVQPDGKILMGGAVRIPSSGTGFEFALARLNSNGSLDNSFGLNGRLTTNIQGNDYGRSILLQPDGKIILAGQSDGGFAVARYIPASLSLTCRPVADFNGDGKSDPAYFSNLFGRWRYLDSITGGEASVRWGNSGDRIVPADYNGDCRTDFAVFRNGTWYIKTLVTGAEIYYQFGLSGDVPVPGDYDGDDLADPAVFRNGIWYVQGTRDGFSAVQFGIAGDKPVPADYDGDGKDDIAVYRDGVWYIQNSSGGVTIVQFGLGTDKPVVGDYDGDAKSDMAVYRPSDGTWYMLRSSQGFASLRWGISSDVPVPADYDGDGKTDVAVYRDGDWYLLQGTSGYQLKRLVADAGDPIVQNAYVP